MGKEGKTKRNSKITYSKIFKNLSADEKKQLGALLGKNENELKVWLKDRNNSLSRKWSEIKKDNGNSSNALNEWQKDHVEFRLWYIRIYIQQKGCCQYCDIPEKSILTIYKKTNGWQEGRRGKILEIDRPNNEGYNKNCVLACYPCNNAKSNVFTEKEFKKIGKTIAKVIKNTN